MRKYSFFITLIYLTTYSQPIHHPPQGQSEYHSLCQFEPIVYFDSSVFRYFLQIHYRIDKSFFILVKSPSPETAEMYSGGGELLFEFSDEQNNLVGREYKKIEIQTKQLPTDQGKPDFIAGACSFRCPAGKYHISTTLDDIESERSFSLPRKPLNIPTVADSTFWITKPFFVDAINEFAKSISNFSVLNTNGNIVIGTKSGAVFQIFGNCPDSTIKIKWSITGESEFPYVGPQTFYGNDFVLKSSIIHQDKENQDRYHVLPTNLLIRTIYLPLNTQRLHRGRFRLYVDVSTGSLNRKDSLQFSVFWPQMPMSLMNPDLAIDALEHLFSKTAFDSLKEKSEKLKIISFFNFWKERNPDSTVAFNPAMAEYYRRVDYTVRHFSTSGQFEGFKTDQGKIYILYGSPTRIDRYLKPGEGPVELWTYQKLRKRYIFADPKKIGVFSLIEIKPI